MIILTAGLFTGGAMAQDSSKWEYKKITDEFTDETKHSIRLNAEEVPTSGEKVSMSIACTDNRTIIQIYTGIYILNTVFDLDDLWETDYRIDDLKGNTFKSFSSHAVFSPFPVTTHIPLIKDMFNHDKLRMRFETFIGSETVTFKITGIETAIKPIREACNW